MMTLALALGLTAAAANADYRVVPLPREIAAAKGDAYRLNGVTRIVYQGDADMARNATFLAEYIAEQTGMLLTTAVADKPEQHEKPEPEARRQSLIAQADLRHMAKSNPFYAEAAKVVQGHLEEKDSASRHKILDYCEHFRTAYTRRDIAFLRQVFSDKALIIVGSVVKSGAQQDGAQSAGMVKYSIRTKEDYLARLEKVFQTNRKINVRFTDFRIMRHPSTDGIYGVQLRQRYQADRYSDDGYLFLLWDFRNPERPLIHVRTWQPETDVREGVELIDLSYINLD